MPRKVFLKFFSNKTVAVNRKSGIFAAKRPLDGKLRYGRPLSNSNGLFYCCRSTAVKQYWIFSPVFFLMPTISFTKPIPSR